MKTTTANWASYTLMFFICIGAAIISACDDECGTIRQTVEVAEPDEELTALLTDCKEGRVSTQSQCTATQSVSFGEARVACACLPLCERMLALVDGFPGPETVKSCTLATTVTSHNSFGIADAGLPLGPNAFQVFLSYVPSNCHAPAK